jgi:hypothetical protein
MLRLCSNSSRPYPGRPALQASQWEARWVATPTVIEQESAAAIVGMDATTGD